MEDDLRVFYGWVRRSREVLLGYCASPPPEIYTQERPDFAFGSFRNLHVHVADCYLWWVGSVGMGQPETDLREQTFRRFPLCGRRLKVWTGWWRRLWVRLTGWMRSMSGRIRTRSGRPA